jgi:hypothetical protein
MTVQDIINGVTLDARNALLSSGTDVAILNDWVDRIHKDCLRNSVYKNLNRSSQLLNLAPGTGQYAINGTGVRQVLTVYDRSNDRFLTSYESVISLGKAAPPIDVSEKLSLSTRSGMPELYKYAAPSSFSVFPTPLAPMTLEIHTENLIASVNGNPTNQLIVPDDGRDIMTAGVNWLAHLYLGRDEAAQFWLGAYVNLKHGDDASPALDPTGEAH